jgi:Ran GTPase-activating protein (RanGAP) involved in mRNA processing and transport
MPALVSLSLALNPVGPQGAELLASSSQLARLEELDLAAAGILSQGALALARSDTLRSLKRLNLRANQITADACQELARARHGDLTYLDLRLNAGTVGLMVAKRDP